MKVLAATVAAVINCHVCGVDRPDDMLAVGVYRFERGGLRMTLRIRYCRDRQPCISGAPGVAERWAHDWHPVDRAVA